MRISRIGSLFAANIDSVSTSRPDTQDTKITNSAPIAPTEAVVVSPNFNRSASSSASESAEARAERLKQLKEQVKRGSYSADSNKVAESIYRDLA